MSLKCEALLLTLEKRGGCKIMEEIMKKYTVITNSYCLNYYYYLVEQS